MSCGCGGQPRVNPWYDFYICIQTRDKGALSMGLVAEWIGKNK